MTNRTWTIYTHFTSRGRTMSLVPQPQGAYKVMLDKEDLGTFPDLPAAFVVAHQEAHGREIEIPGDIADWKADETLTNGIGFE